MLSARIWMLLLLSSLAAGVGAGGVYKWIDAQGNVHYGERPPKEVAAESMKVQKAPVDKDQAEMELEKLNLKAGLGAEDEKAREQAQGKRQETAQGRPTADEAELQRKNCEIARQNLATLERYRRVMTQDAQGNPVRLDDDERAARMEQARKHVEEFCDD